MDGFTLLRNLPSYTGSAAYEGVELVAVAGNTGAVRIGLDAVVGSFVRRASEIPEGTSQQFSDGSITWDRSGIYTLNSHGWSKTPAYSGNWDDLTPTTRFLRVDDRMNLDTVEARNARESIGVLEADVDGGPGMVRLTDDICAIGRKVAPAHVVKGYVDGLVESYRSDYDCMHRMKACTCSIADTARCYAGLACTQADRAGMGASCAETMRTFAVNAAEGAECSRQNACLAARKACTLVGSIVTIDSEPRCGSVNAVSSGGVYAWSNNTFTGVNVFRAHSEDSDVHVSPADRARWDAAAAGGQSIDSDAVCMLHGWSRCGRIRNAGNGRLSMVSNGSVVFDASVSNGAGGAPATILAGGSVGICANGPDGAGGPFNIYARCARLNGNLLLDEGDISSMSVGDVQPGIVDACDIASYVSCCTQGVLNSVAGSYMRRDAACVARTGADNRFTGTNRFCGCVKVSSCKGVLLDEVASTASIPSNALYNSGGDLYWGTSKLNGQGGGEGGGDVYKDYDNTFTGINTFTDSVIIDNGGGLQLRKIAQDSPLSSSAVLYNKSCDLYWKTCRLTGLPAAARLSGGENVFNNSNMFCGDVRVFNAWGCGLKVLGCSEGRTVETRLLPASVSFDLGTNGFGRSVLCVRNCDSVRKLFFGGKEVLLAN